MSLTLVVLADTDVVTNDDIPQVFRGMRDGLGNVRMQDMNMGFFRILLFSRSKIISFQYGQKNLGKNGCLREDLWTGKWRCVEPAEFWVTAVDVGVLAGAWWWEPGLSRSLGVPEHLHD